MRYFVDIKCVDCGSLSLNKEVSNANVGSSFIQFGGCCGNEQTKYVTDYEAYDIQPFEEFGKIWISTNRQIFLDPENQKVDAIYIDQMKLLQGQNDLLLQQNKLLLQLNRV